MEDEQPYAQHEVDIVRLESQLEAWKWIGIYPRLANLDLFHPNLRLCQFDGLWTLFKSTSISIWQSKRWMIDYKIVGMEIGILHAPEPS